jgi:hypothetical protein
MRNLRGVIPSHLRQRADTLGVLDQWLTGCLPADCRPHCRVSGMDGDTLVLVADSPAWRSRIHFLGDSIIRHFQRLDKLAIERVRVRVGPAQPPARPRARRSGITEPPAAAARALEELATEVDDEVLAASLRRLARRRQSE